jgi:hypothetical protein
MMQKRGLDAFAWSSEQVLIRYRLVLLIQLDENAGGGDVNPRNILAVDYRQYPRSLDAGLIRHYYGIIKLGWQRTWAMPPVSDVLKRIPMWHVNDFANSVLIDSIKYRPRNYIKCRRELYREGIIRITFWRG